MCFAGQFAKLDRQLNTDYVALTRKLSGDARAIELIRESERAWVDYRGKECTVEAYPTEGGSVQPTVESMCLIALTKDRLKIIDGQLNCSGGDLTCILPPRQP